MARVPAATHLGTLDQQTVYEGEVVGTLLALDIARNLPPAVKHSTVLLDNQAAVNAACARRSKRGQ